MKIIALVPVKNEGWVLPTYLSSVSKIADEIIAIDDGSTDNSVEILKNAGATVIFTSPELRKEKIVNMSTRRKLLLGEGRKRGGTHFIWLDADEAFTSEFIHKGKEIISELKPGEKISMQWILLFGSQCEQRVDGVWNNLYKDFIVYDQGDMDFDNKYISEARTEGKASNLIKIDPRDGAVLHFHLFNIQKSEAKQAYYRCLELLKGERGAKKINSSYSITSLKWVVTKPLDREKFEGLILPSPDFEKKDWHIQSIIDWFDQYGILFFEPLEIWHIQELKEEFIKRVGRVPYPKTYPRIIIYLNNLRNKLKNL